MNFLSKFLGGSQDSGDSYVRTWTAQRKKELEYTTEVSSETLFAALMYCLVSFARKDPRRKTPAEMKKLGMDITEHFSGDATLFEVGCYMFFRLDVWLFQNKPDFRKSISDVYNREFKQLFTKALGINNVSALFNQRVDKYGELVRRGADTKEYFFHLSQLILKTKDNTPPEAYDFDKAPIVLGGMLEKMGIEIELGSWATSMLPAMFESLENYCSLKEKE